ncbi:MAG: hypothetical protein PHT44_04515 [Candidatus Portnoybacteria bacterium]|nr:hypothetical protein [Candidatus Portnoybacteria bacterium]
MNYKEQPYINKNRVRARWNFSLKNTLWLMAIPWLIFLYLLIITLFFHAMDMARLFQKESTTIQNARGTVLLFMASGVLLIIWLVLYEEFHQNVLEFFEGLWETREFYLMRLVLGRFSDKHPKMPKVMIVSFIVLNAVFVINLFLFLPISTDLEPVIATESAAMIDNHSYSHVLREASNKREAPNKTEDKQLRLTLATHILSGKAVVTQIGPHTYQVRMMPS